MRVKLSPQCSRVDVLASPVSIAFFAYMSVYLIRGETHEKRSQKRGNGFASFFSYISYRKSKSEVTSMNEQTSSS